jgi:RNA-directed DNA polymerase
MEEALCRENVLAAHKRVVRNGGAPGVDGMTVDELMPYCREHWARIREELLGGRYRAGRASGCWASRRCWTG